MFVTTRPWQSDKDYRKLVHDLQPPPPPSEENTWELHFCKWWGWNWVKRGEIAVDTPFVKSTAKPLVESKKPEKTSMKQLCNSLCFRKKKQKDLQKLYNTPSNSIIEDKKTETPDQHLQELYDTPSNSIVEEQQYKKTRRDSPVSQNTCKTSSITKSSEDVETQISRETKKEVYAPPKKNFLKSEKKNMKDWASSSSDECSCTVNKNGSSTEDTVEYINITRCPCCHPKKPAIREQSVQPFIQPVRQMATQEPLPAKKELNQKYIQSCSPKCKMIATQTEKLEKKRRRRHICVICCSCGQYSPPCCCPCENKSGKNADNTKKKIRCCGCECSTDKTHYNNINAYNVTNNQPHPFRKESMEHSNKKQKNLSKKLEPFYATGMPLNTKLYYNKPITKFGAPSQDYPWIHATKSDIWDQLSHLKISREFFSPVSGKMYNISPIKIDTVKEEPSVLLNPISVEEELQTLRKIDDDLKMDFKSRIMLDAVCDSILAKDKEYDCSSSIFLNEFTYPSNVTQTERIIKDIYKPVEKRSSKSNQTTLDEIIFEDITSESENKRVNSNTDIKKLNFDIQKNNSLRDYLNMHSSQTYTVENSYKKIMDDVGPSCSYNSPQQHLLTNKKNIDSYIIDAVKKDQISIPAYKEPAFTRTGLMPTYKRSASPTSRTQYIKKAKLKQPCTLANFDNTNVSDIFKKIDEIVLRSKVNNKEMQNVLNTIPKKTFQFFTGFQVSNLENQSPMCQDTENGKANTLPEIKSREVIEKQEYKIKTSQVKKKKMVNRPSLIPKRVINAKCTKKNID